MAYAGVHVSKVARHHFRVTASPHSATLLSLPVLTSLELSFSSDPRQALIVPDSFFGWICTIYLSGIPFPGLPKLLLSTTDLVDPHLSCNPHSGYISPETMATAVTFCLDKTLEKLMFSFESPRPHPDCENRQPSFTTCLNGFLITVTRSLGT